MALNPLISLQAGQGVPDVGQTFSNVLTNLTGFEKLREIQRQREAGSEIRELLGQAAMPVNQAQSGAQQVTQEDLIRRAQAIDPEIAEKTIKSLGMDSPSRLEEGSRFAAKIQGMPIEQQNKAILERVESLRSENRDPSHTLELLDMGADQRNRTLTNFQLAALSTKDRLSLRARDGKTDKAAQVKSSDILPDGSTIQVMGDGSTRVTDPMGNALTGEARANTVKTAQEFGVDIQQRRSQARRIGTLTAGKAESVFERAEKIRENNDTLRGVIAEVKAGASTGRLVNLLPSVRASTLRLENLKNRLGLDVVGSVTFGALSESELKMAMDTALPTGLAGPELTDWAENKIASQEKLASYLEQQAEFLSRPGNDQAGWRMEVEAKRQQQAQQQPAQPQQQVIRFNRQGQRIE